MNLQDKRNPAASVRTRLVQLAREQGEDPMQLLVRYATERFLYRLSHSAHRSRFVLKGARLFELWTGERHRPTRDIDFLSCGSPEVAELLPVFQEICSQIIPEPDGIVFPLDRISGVPAREDREYQGASFKLIALLGTAAIPIQIDLGFGDAVTPEPQLTSIPTLLDTPCPQLLVYPRETVIAEKLQALTALGMANSRMKDFYDLWYLAQRFDFDGATLAGAISATFARRKTLIRAEPPTAFTPEFFDDPGKRVQWEAFVKRSRLTGEGTSLPEVVAALRTFFLPILTAAATNQALSSTWRAASQCWES
jgi:hypothetical protein